MPTITAITRKGPKSWLYEWSGTAPFDVYIDGAKRLDQSTLTQLIVSGDSATTPPAMELRDATSTGTAQSVQYSPLMRLQWRGQADAALYKVQRYVSATWTTQQIVREDGRGYYTFTTVALTDGTAEQWRIVPQDARGYTGAAIIITETLVCNPAPPNVTITYTEGTTTLTVAAT